MIKIINTLPQINELFDNGNFNLEKWKIYINSIYSDCEDIFLDDVKEYVSTEKYTFENDFLPIINAVYKNPKLCELQASFERVIDGLNEKIITKFSKEIDADIVLYLGLCNGAGWVTEINGRTVVLLGIEKIIELDGTSIDDMRGLIYHELGHVYQAQYGVLEYNTQNREEAFVGQLFTEGIAMYFEQVLVGNINYYHQDKNGWKTWCDEHFEQILRDFKSDLPTMNNQNQRYFGDWADYLGYGDVGYYLGARFVHYLLEEYDFDDLINFDIDKIYKLFDQLCNIKPTICLPIEGKGDRFSGG